MSVAFRRDSDEEHLEPKFELPIPPGPNLVTRRGPALIAARVASLETRIATSAEEERAPLQRDLRYWHTRATTAEVAAPPPAGEAGIGSRVRFRQEGRERAIEIVGVDEADPAAGRIGFHAPLARALIGAAQGDQIAFAGGAIEIVGIEEADD